MVALDGSDKDARALAVGEAIARLAEAELDRVQVGSPPQSNTQAGDPDFVAAELIRQAVAREALLMVLATRALGAMERAVIGSVADRVVRQSPRPVVLVPPPAAHLGGKHVTFKRIMVPLDGSSLAFRCLEFLMQLPHATSLDYVLIEVVQPRGSRQAADDRLRTSAAWLRSRGVKTVDEVVIEAGDVAATIVGAVREVLPDAIAMSSRGRGGLARLTLGSVAEGVVRASELPVMVLTPETLATSAAG
jgi:nucleotide-binding universal stress UspA family protein